MSYLTFFSLQRANVIIQGCWGILASLMTYKDMASHLQHAHGTLPNVRLTPQMEAFNSSMSSLRTSVEGLFGDICTYFKFIDFKKDLKIGIWTVGKMSSVCIIEECTYLSIWQYNIKNLWSRTSRPEGLFWVGPVVVAFLHVLLIQEHKGHYFTERKIFWQTYNRSQKKH